MNIHTNRRANYRIDISIDLNEIQQAIYTEGNGTPQPTPPLGA